MSIKDPFFNLVYFKFLDFFYNTSINPMNRQNMSKKGKTLVDGKGLDRIISSIPRELLG